MMLPPKVYKLGGKWYCSYLELRECPDPAMLPVDEVQIETLRMDWRRAFIQKSCWMNLLLFKTVKGPEGQTSLKLQRLLTTEEMTKESGD
jgi:hypothetical protein